jgi:branched-chain amino acid transport system permease protein
MAANPLRALGERVGELPGYDRAVGVWRSPRVGGVLRGAVGLGALWVALQILLRNNPPGLGIYVYGVIIGLLYSLLAIGLILIYRATRIINFAQAEIGAATGVMAVVLIKVHHVPYAVAFVVAIGSGMVAGMIVEFLVIRRFQKASRLVLSVATIGVGLVFAGLQLLVPSWLGADKLIDPAPPRTPF